MSVLWLQAGAAILLSCWFFLMISMKNILPVLKAVEKMDEWVGISEDALEETENDPVEVNYSFSRWEEVIASDEENMQRILSNPLWSGQGGGASIIEELCKQNNISIIDIKDIEAQTNQPMTLYFDDPSMMPVLWDRNYNIQLVNSKSFIDLFNEASPFSIIILSVKDDGSQALNHKWQERLSDFGIRELTREHLRNSYINVIWKKYDNVYVSLFEEWSDEPLLKNYKKDDTINGFKFPMDIQIISKGYDSGNYSSIVIEGKEYSSNLRGMNMVVYDVVDSRVEAANRVDTFVTMYDDRTVYRAVPIEVKNEL
ncbi:interleukin-like EMT inducer domain-containing protein [Paenibacillus sinopodophylli]|uniref:interleukin-like EMT inducer domain-containing protein n=1 Tax=Paenibacillus sinopodophylli TaxID=1837342 RepID=UPI00110CB99F|nr:interleukin-like EMT inducer domain-containing protein [Paenibacillus sinopodophylli]